MAAKKSETMLRTVHVRTSPVLPDVASSVLADVASPVLADADPRLVLGSSHWDVADNRYH